MEQLEFFDIPSPCINVCQADNRGYCLGCLRSRDERLNWLKYTPAQKTHVVRLCRQRKRRRYLALMKKRAEQDGKGQSTAGNGELDLD